MEKVLLTRLCVGPVGTNCYLLGLEGRDDCVLIDPGAEPERIRQAKDGRRTDAILFTHGHFDHIGGGKALCEAHTRVMIHAMDEPMLHDAKRNAGWLLMREEIEGPDATDLVKDGDTIKAAGLTFRVMHTPGHTQGSVCYLLDQGDTHCLFSGDTVMAMGIGRTDLPGGDTAMLRESLARIRPLLNDYVLLGGHG